MISSKEQGKLICWLQPAESSIIQETSSNKRYHIKEPVFSDFWPIAGLLEYQVPFIS
jgi:hypothetical protein